MAYTTLKKAFHNPKLDYDALYQARYFNDKTIHLDIEIAGHQAFFCCEEALYEKMLKIAKVDKKVLALTQQLPGRALQQYTERTLIDEIVLTNGIEGVHTSRKEVGSILRNLENQNKRKRFYGLVNKYVLLTQKENISLRTLKDIRDVYDDLVLSEVASDRPDNIPDGKLFRKDSVSVYDAAGEEIHQGIQPEAKINKYLMASLDFLEADTVALPIRAAIFHYLIGYIHPFYDGNGRLNRFISSFLLLQEYEPLVGLRLSYAVTQNIEKYYKGFMTCNNILNKGDLTPFAIMFLDIIEIAVNDIVAVLTEKKNLFETNLERLMQVAEISTDRDLYELASILLQARLFSGEGISVQELIEIFHVTRPTVKKRLAGIEAASILEKNRVGREIHYQLNLDSLARTVQHK